MRIPVIGQYQSTTKSAFSACAEQRIITYYSAMHRNYGL